MNSFNSVCQCIEIDYGDPICSIALNDSILVFGSMLGRAVAFDIKRNKSYLLFSSATEHITGTEVYNEGKFSVAVGDYEVITYTSSGDGIIQSEKHKNYDSDHMHHMKCDKCYTAMKGIFLIRVFLKLAEDDSEQQSVSTIEYIVKNLNNNECDKGSFDMSNYIVPVDYSGPVFAWIDFYSSTDRSLCQYNCITKKVTKIQLDHNYGHISHIKLLPNNSLFVVRKYNICEIRDDKFQLQNIFGHIGDEVIACDWFMNGKELEITTLDIGGNVNVYKKDNDTIVKLFNMYELNSISLEDKEKQFFTKGYPYYIKATRSFIAVTTDYGCYLIKR